MITQKQDALRQELFTSAYNNYAKGLGTYAFFKVHNNVTSKDLVQNTFIKTWSYIVKGGEIVTMKAFLYHILNQLIVDEYRKHKTVSLDVLVENGFEPNANDSENLFDFLDGKAATLLIKRLPTKYQKAIGMRYIQNLSLKEMAILTRQSRNTVAVQLHRGLAKLKLLYNFA